MTALMLCADPLAPSRSRRADPHFTPDFEAAQDLGVPTAVVDHDALVSGDAAAAVRRVPRDLGDAWYRGWMMRAAEYAALEEALAARGCRLLTPAGDYQRAHELPGWYAAFRDHTPTSVWTGDLAALHTWLDTAADMLGSRAAIVKDFVKSRKHEWETACYIPDLTDRERLRRIVRTFVELQGEDLYEGVVLRAFEDFTDPHGDTGQARIWWVDARAVLVTAHPDTPDHRVEPPLDGIADAVEAFGARFVTTDLARRSDGQWRVIEVGDGQVSDFPAGADIRPLVEALSRTQ